MTDGRVASLMIVGTLVLTACGGGSDEGANLEPYVIAVAAHFAETGNASDEQSRCAAEQVIDAIDEDVITEFDTPEDFVSATDKNLAALDLDDETLDTIAEGYVSCLGGMQFVLDALTDSGASDEQVECVRGSITEDEMVADFRADVAGETDEALETQLDACFES
jgi:hypothetical protein